MRINLQTSISSLLILTSSICFGAERESLISSNNAAYGGFGGLVAKSAQLNGQSNILIGGKGAWLIDHSLYIGGAGYGSSRKISDTQFRMGYGGLLMGYIFQPNHMLHFNVELLAGAGGLGDEQHERKNNHDERGDVEDVFSIIEPGANLSFSITKFADISAGMSYRYVQSIDTENLTDSNLSGWSFNTSVVFGKF